MMLVVAHFKPDIRVDEETAGDTDGKAEDIDDGIDFIAEKIPKRDGEVVEDHIEIQASGLSGKFAQYSQGRARRGQHKHVRRYSNTRF
jgi:hypothetical protein